MITFETLTATKANTVAIWKEIEAIENAIIRAIEDLGIESIIGKYKFSDDRLVIKFTNMNLSKSSYQQFQVKVDWFKKIVTIQHFNALTDKREDAVIGFDDLCVAPTVMYKHVKNKMQIVQATVKEMEFAYENK